MKSALRDTVLIILLIAGVMMFSYWLRLKLTEPATDRKPVDITTNVKLFIDPDTGCHWLTRDGYITPRLSGDGKQVCVL